MLFLNRGVRALAREIGMSASNVSKRMKKGETAEQIRLSVEARGFMKSGRRDVPSYRSQVLLRVPPR